MVQTKYIVRDNLSLVIHGAKDMRLEQTRVKDQLDPNGMLPYLAI